MRASKAQVALSVIAFYVAKLLVAAALCAAPANAAPTASGAILPGFVVLCTPDGARTMAFDDARSDTQPNPHDGQVECPMCAATCKLPLLPAQLVGPNERPIVYIPAPWAPAAEAPTRRRLAAHFRSRAPPPRGI